MDNASILRAIDQTVNSQTYAGKSDAWKIAEIQKCLVFWKRGK